jgi:hypothetical protein
MRQDAGHATAAPAASDRAGTGMTGAGSIGGIDCCPAPMPARLPETFPLAGRLPRSLIILPF